MSPPALVSLAGAVGQHVGVISEGDRVRRAGLAGEVRRSSAGVKEAMFFSLARLLMASATPNSAYRRPHRPYRCRPIAELY